MISKAKEYKLTREDIRPFLANASTTPSGRNPTEEAVRILGYEKDLITIDWKNEDGSGEFSDGLDRFLCEKTEIFDDGYVRFVYGETDDTTFKIRDFPIVSKKIEEVRKVASVLCDTDLMLSRWSIERTAERAVRETFHREWNSQVRSNEAVVRLSKEQWERVTRLYEVISYKGKAHRQYVHDPWVVMTAERAVAVAVNEMDSGRDWNFYDGICIFVPDEENSVKYEKDYPMDYWD